MRDDRAQVDQDPAAVGIPLRTGDRKAVFTGGLADRVGDRPRLNLRAAGNDYEGVGDDGPALQLEDGDVFAFLVFGGGADDVDEFRQSVSPGASGVRNVRGRPAFAVPGYSCVRDSRPAIP